MLPFRTDFSECAPITLERRLESAQCLPSENHNVDVFGVKFHTAADSFCQVRGGEGSARAQKRVVNQLALFCVVQDRAPHTLHGLLCAVNRLRILIAVLDGPKRTLFAVATPVAGRPYRVPTRLMLPVVMSTPDDERRFG